MTCSDAGRASLATDESRDDLSAWLDQIRSRRRQLEEFMRRGYRITKVDVDDHCRDSLRNSYLGPQTSAPAWLVHILENGIALPLVRMLSSVDERHVQQAISGLSERSGSSDHSPQRQVRLALSSTSLVSRYRSLGYSPLALSGPAIFVAEEIFRPENPRCDSHRQPWLQNEDTQLSSRDTNQKRLIQPYQNICSPIHEAETDSNVTSQDSQNFTVQRRSVSDNSKDQDRYCNQSTEGPKQNGRPLTTSSAAVTECRPGRVVISGSFETRQWGSLPFRLVMFPCQIGPARSATVKGIFLRQSFESSHRLRWRFQCQMAPEVIL